MKFKMSGNLLRFAEFKSEVEVNAATIEGGVAKLVEDMPKLKPVLFDAHGNFRSFHRLFLNGDLIASDELGQQAAASDEITILTAIAGG